MKIKKFLGALILATVIFFPMKSGEIYAWDNTTVLKTAIQPQAPKSVSGLVPTTVPLFTAGIIGLIGLNQLLRK
jgi:hypothetical protein